MVSAPARDYPLWWRRIEVEGVQLAPPKHMSHIKEA